MRGGNKQLIKNMGRSPSRDENNGLKKGPWTPEEDQKLVIHIQLHGHGSWRALPKLAGLNRCGKSCRLRWTNYLRPDIKRGKFSQEEEQTILNLHSILGNKWSAIATHLPGRTDNEIKNFWNTHLKKKLIQMGFDPMTHRPRTDLFSSLPQLIALASLKEFMDNNNQLPYEELISRLVQTEAVNEMVRVRYIQSILQSNILATTNYPTNIADNVQAFILLNSLSLIKENSTSSMVNSLPQLDNMAAIPYNDHDLPQLQDYSCNNFQTSLGDFRRDIIASQGGSDFALLNEGENITPKTSLGFPSSPADDCIRPTPPTAHRNDRSASSLGESSDACSTNTTMTTTNAIYGGEVPSLFWPELYSVEDPSFYP